MTDTFRALCAELMDEAIYLGSLLYEQDPDPDLIARARAELAKPELVTPTESDVTELFYRHMGEGSQVGFENAIAEALARWGRPAIEPVPVSERLPVPEDCDKEGCCWWWDYGQDSWSQGMPEYCINRHTHWLPHYALPVPGVEGADD